MRIRMIKMQPAALDGIHVEILESGRVYDLPDAMARAFLESGRAEEDKALDGPPESKAPAGPEAKRRRR